jgi:hypothetical protein
MSHPVLITIDRHRFYRIHSTHYKHKRSEPNYSATIASNVNNGVSAIKATMAPLP